ncbi:serine/threonine-protein kinase [Geodermatophilus sp. SYSU D00079]
MPGSDEMALPQSLLEPGGHFGDYLIESIVGRGGMGVVYRARDTRLDRPVALKLLAPELTVNSNFRSRFVRESRLAAAVDHPNIIPIYEAGDAGGRLFLAMRFVRGVDLRTDLDRRGCLPLDEALDVLAQTAAALDAAHDAGLVHRDVKPANILLADSPHGGRRHVYLTDFGLTKRSASESGLTATGHFLGTLDYVPPEQIRGEPVDARADVYALACVAYAVLVGHPPFDHEDDAAVLWAHMSTDPPPPSRERPELPPAVDDALAAGLAKDRDDRPATCGELLARMGAGAVEPPVRERSVGRPRPEPSPGGRRGPRRPVLLAVAAALVLAVAAVAVVLLRGERGWTTFTDPGIPYRLDVPGDWVARTDGAGDSAVTVLSPAELPGLFADDPAAMAAAAATAEDDPGSVVGLAVYQRPRLGGASAAVVLESARALLPGQDATLTPRGTTPAGDLEAQLMTGQFGLAEDVALQVRVLALESTPPQLLVLFAPPSEFAAESATFDRVVGSLRTTG